MPNECDPGVVVRWPSSTDHSAPVSTPGWFLEFFGQKIVQKKMGYVMYGRSVVFLALGATLTAVGCSVSVGSNSIDKADVEKQVSTQLAASVGQQPKSVTCPGDLRAKVGTSMRCHLVTPQGTNYGVTATVTSVNGGDAHFSIKVDDHPSSG